MSSRDNTKTPVHGGAKLVFGNKKELILDSKCLSELLDVVKKYRRADHSRVLPIKSESYPLTCGLCMRTILPDRREGTERRVTKEGIVLSDRRLRNRRKILVEMNDH